MSICTLNLFIMSIESQKLDIKAVFTAYLTMAILFNNVCNVSPPLPIIRCYDIQIFNKLFVGELFVGTRLCLLNHRGHCPTFFSC